MSDEVLAYVLDDLSPEQRARVEAMLASNPDNRRELQAIVAKLEGIAEALPPAHPSPDLKRRLFASLQANPFLPFVDRLAELFDLSHAAAEAVLQRAKQPKEWSAFAPGIWLLHLEGGPKTAGADVGLVRVAGKGSFPDHGHGGLERSLVLQGEMQEPSGERHGPGSLVEMPPGSQHEFSVSSEQDLIYAVVVWDVKFGAMYHLRRLLALLRQRIQP